MKGNRRFGDGSTIIAGPFFVFGTTECSLKSFTDEEVTKYMSVFKEPEQITQEQVEADSSITIISGI